MPRPKRCEQFTTSDICIVHITQRCVRRAWLAGFDQVTGIDYSFRKEWIRRRMEALASVFAIDVLSYAIMSNHMHQILRNRPDVCATWTDEEVAIRWLRVYPGKRLEEHLAEPNENDVKTLARNKKLIAIIRERLCDLSWFMRALSEPIARMANKQDECTGSFWEGRFKAQRIVDEAALLACSMYVDLNPVRAAIAENVEDFPHTSAFDRIKSRRGAEIPSAAFDLVAIRTDEAGRKIRETTVDTLRAEKKQKKKNPTGRRVRRDGWLSPIRLKPEKLTNDAEVHADGLRSSNRGFLSVNWEAYWELLCWTAKQSVDGLSAEIPKSLVTVVGKLGIDVTMWRDLVWHWPKFFGKSSCVGRPDAVKEHARQTGRRHHHGQASSACCFT
ncbi:hypothetical protein [Rhodopirellula sp. MGV]|uniref:hypothetical protein n=1 Tax=Rhodopirellula sp. MGV TaxID=2023130 RepID=UPI000B9791D4|nr:hypothetical protein [Rhodopirellula sp. MGV]OYP28505.1 hypothetical protein CGZ80_26110 [Rhodopirellula sp. MGV]PNY38921.1 hypothetical protein C2E31_02685 [Rhodopirellula baltica]